MLKSLRHSLQLCALLAALSGAVCLAAAPLAHAENNTAPGGGGNAGGNGGPPPDRGNGGFGNGGFGADRSAGSKGGFGGGFSRNDTDSTSSNNANAGRSGNNNGFGGFGGLFGGNGPLHAHRSDDGRNAGDANRPAPAPGDPSGTDANSGSGLAPKMGAPLVLGAGTGRGKTTPTVRLVQTPVLDQEQSKRAIQGGQAASMPLLLAYLDQKYPGQVLDVKLHSTTEGLVYEVRYLANIIELRTLFLDAQTLNRK